jgi:hypothetical protein
MDFDIGEQVYKSGNNAGQGRIRMWFWFIKSCQTWATWHLALSCMLKDVIKVSLLQKGQNDRNKNTVPVFHGIYCSLNNRELSATIVTKKRKIHRTFVIYLCTSGTTSRMPLSNDGLFLWVGDVGCRCCKRWSHTLLNSANLHTAWQVLSVHDLFW